MQHDYEIGGERYKVRVQRRPGAVTIARDESEHRANMRDLGDGQYLLELDGVPHRVWLAVLGDRTFIHMDGRAWDVLAIDDLARAMEQAHHKGEDTTEAPMPGTVIGVHVSEGDAVHKGQTLVVIESMKMETSITAWRDGTVHTVHVPLGATFDRKAPLVTLAPLDE